MDQLQADKKNNKQSYILQKLCCYGDQRMGCGPNKFECQDSQCMIEGFNNNWNFFSVYDGHGEAGKEASFAVNDYFQIYLEKNMMKKQLQFPKDINLIKKFIHNMHDYVNHKLVGSGIYYSNSGTCALGVLIIDNYCFISNMGDSRAVLYRENDNQTLAIELSKDQRVTQTKEKERILKKGGKIGQRIDSFGNMFGKYLMWNDSDYGLQVGRSLGDCSLKQFGLSQQPEITQIELIDSDQFLILATDGLWDVMSSDEACFFVKKNYHPNAENIAELLISECRKKWDTIAQKYKNSRFPITIDDISVIIIKLSIEVRSS